MTAASGTSVVGEMEGHYTAAMRFGVALIVPGGHWHSVGVEWEVDGWTVSSVPAGKAAAGAMASG